VTTRSAVQRKRLSRLRDVGNIFVPIALAVACTGCGLVFQGTRQQVAIDTIPSGRAIEVDGKPYTTPVTVDLKRKDKHVVTASNDHGAIARRVIEPVSNSFWHLPDAILLPFFGNVIDIVSGADRKLHPDALVIPVPADDAALGRWW